MFTGLVSAVGRYASLQEGRLRVLFSSEWTDGDPLAAGESVAVNGCCLTVVDWGSDWADFELSEETFRRTTFSASQEGELLLNLERAAKVGDRLGGHIVQGHIDGVGTVVGVEVRGEYSVLTFQLPPEADKLLIDKGSVALDGVSLTVVNPVEARFECWIIPHTLAHTNLRSQKPGDKVNFELDCLAKHVEKLLSPR